MYIVGSIANVWNGDGRYFRHGSKIRYLLIDLSEYCRSQMSGYDYIIVVNDAFAHYTILIL